MERKTILLILVFLAILINYLKREGFTSEGKLTEYLNTWKATNDEIKNTFQVGPQEVKFNKEAKAPNFRADNDLSAPHIYGGNFIQTKKVTTQDGIKIGYPNNVNMDHDTYRGAIHKAGDGDNAGMDIVGFGNPRKVKIYDQLCIKDTCINEDHLKALTGQKSIFLKSERNNKYLQQDNNKTNKEAGNGVRDHDHLMPENAWFNGGKGDWEKLRLEL